MVKAKIYTKHRNITVHIEKAIYQYRKKENRMRHQRVGETIQ
jgi:hypothetical protein